LKPKKTFKQTEKPGKNHVENPGFSSRAPDPRFASSTPLTVPTPVFPDPDNAPPALPVTALCILHTSARSAEHGVIQIQPNQFPGEEISRKYPGYIFNRAGLRSPEIVLILFTRGLPNVSLQVTV